MSRTDLFTAVQALKNGEVIIYPTDTLYALGADVYNESAVRRIFNIKKRPLSYPLSVAVATIEDVEIIAYVNETARKIMHRFLPGTLTVVLKKKPSVPDIVTSGLDNIAVRIPKNMVALDLLSRYGPLTVTSANIHDKKPLYIIKDILMQLETTISICLDDGRLDGRPSTIVDLMSSQPIIIRKGLITKQQLLDAIHYE